MIVPTPQHINHINQAGTSAGVHLMTLASWVTTASTAVIAFFTFALWRATSKQSKLTRDSIDLAKAEFVSTHRPKIIVRNVKLIFGLEIEEPVLIDFICVNIGDSAATLKKIEARIFIKAAHEKIPQTLNLQELANLWPKLAPGELSASQIRQTLGLTSEIIEQIKFGNCHLCIVGCVQYEDNNTVKRQTGFARRVAIGADGRIEERLMAIDDDDYEYAY